MGEYGILKTIKVKIKVNEQTGRISYRTVFTNKRQDGETEFASMFIRFVRDAKDKIATADNKDCYIKIKDGFLSFNTNEDKSISWVLVIQDFDFDTTKDTVNEEFEYDQEDLPF